MNKSKGLFFEKRAQASDGKFFQRLPGRVDANFFGKQSMALESPQSSKPKPAEGTVNIGATGAPVGGQGFRGEGMSGGMYGTGDGESGDSKVAGRSPSDWDNETELPNGQHRPAREQPEELEAGTERFFDSGSEGPDFRADSMRHGLKEGGSLHVPSTTGHQMGKHASTHPPRFLGTSMGKEAGLGSEFKDSLSRAGSGATDAFKQTGRGAAGVVEEGAHSIAKSPGASVAVTGLAALLALRGGKGALKGLKGLAKKKTIAKAGVKAAPAGLKDKAKSAIQKLVGRISD